jgi:hypothetical protein
VVRSSRPLLISGIVLILLLGGVWLANRAATSIVEGPKFRAAMEKETAKGMHFESAHYAPFVRTGVLSVHSDSGEGDKGFKTIENLRGEDVSGAFNPLGVFLRRWQLQYLHFARGMVRIQKTAGNPNAQPPPGQPWYLFFWPDHVYLQDVTCNDADVLFKLKDQDSGIHDTYLEITPNGRDFEYDARGGTFTTPDTPRLNVEHIHLLVRKPRLDCPTLVLGDDPAHPEEQVSVTGEAGLQQDRGIKAQAKFTSLQVAPWAPEKLRAHLHGHFSGQIDYQSSGTGLDTATAQGHLSLADGVVSNLKAVRTFIAATKSPDPGAIPLDVCETDVALAKGDIKLDKLAIESKGIFRLSGHVQIARDKTVSGELELGLTHAYLRWLPALETDIFTRRDGGYYFTTIHLSGTSARPQQDLSARLTAELARHPFVALKLFFNSNALDVGD